RRRDACRVRRLRVPVLPPAERRPAQARGVVPRTHPHRIQALPAAVPPQRAPRRPGRRLRAPAGAGQVLGAARRVLPVDAAAPSRSPRPLTPETTDRLAGEVGLDTARLWADMGGGACGARVQADVDEGRTIGIEATPTLLVNGLKITGMRSFAELRAIVGEELSPGWLSDLTEP